MLCDVVVFCVVACSRALHFTHFVEKNTEPMVIFLPTFTQKLMHYCFPQARVTPHHAKGEQLGFILCGTLLDILLRLGTYRRVVPIFL